MTKKSLFLVFVIVIGFVFYGGTMSFAANYKMYYSINEATNITSSSAVISGSIIRGEQIDNNITVPGYVFSLKVFETKNPDNEQQVPVGGGTRGGDFEEKIENLKPDTEYTFLVIGHSVNINPLTDSPIELTFSTSSETTQEFLYGDVNGDGRINSIDYILVKRYILGIITEFATEDGLKAADVDNNGSINSIDLSYIRRYILGIINAFPAEQKWIPYVINEEHVSFDLERKTDGNYIAKIKLTFPTNGYRVSYVDRVNMAVPARYDPDGIRKMFLSELASIEAYTGLAQDVITTLELNYTLGILYPGKYEFVFVSNGHRRIFQFAIENDDLWHIYSYGQFLDPFSLEQNEDGSYIANVKLTFPTSGYIVDYNDEVTMTVPTIPDPDGANIVLLGDTAYISRSSGPYLNAVHYKDVKYTLGKLEPGIYKFIFNSNNNTNDNSRSYLFEIPEEEELVPYELNDRQVYFNIIKNQDGEYDARITIRFPTAGYSVTYNEDVTREFTGVQHPDKTLMVFRNDSFKVEANTNPLIPVPTIVQIDYKLGKLTPAKYEFVFCSNDFSKTFPFEIR
ncbi:UNVERIFIED_CONTAM: dockerin type I repeat protein [Acetivibrio alkalicellulosi]